MEATSIRKALTITLVGLVLFSFLNADDIVTAVRENDLIRELKERMKHVSDNYQEDRLYLQLDKPYYEPGDDIWFSATVLDAATMKASTKSEVIHIELVSPKGTIEQTYKLMLKNGKAAGDFRISETMPGGIYTVKAYTNWMKNERNFRAFEKQVQVQELILPSIKMSLEFQRKSYAPGQEVTAKIRLIDNEDQPMTNHKIRYQITVAGERINELTTSTGNDGSTMLSFALPEKMKTSDALLSVLTEYRGSTESISRAIPVFRNKFNIKVFPEGGDLVQSLPSRVAFRVTNEFGKPADISGVILDEDENEITTFTSFHAGMGTFDITPQAGKHYHLKITNPQGCDELVDLPAALPAGYVIKASSVTRENIELEINSTETEEVTILGSARNRIYYSNAVSLNPGSNKVIVSASAFPAGIVSFTLFDEQGIERCERLAFINDDKKLSIQITTNKEQYLPREKVKMNINVRDHRGIPVPASLSLSVVNDNLISLAADKSSNIYSALYLEPELKEKVDEPAFYFDPKEPKAKKALDHLLMTSGWRRFTWEEIRNGELPDLTFKGEKAILAGVVTDGYTGKPVADADVTIGKRSVSTNAEGRFVIRKNDLAEASDLKVTAQGYSVATLTVDDYSENLKIHVFNHQRIRAEEQEAVFEEQLMNAPEIMADDIRGAAEVFNKRAVPAAAIKEKVQVEKKKVVNNEKPVKKAENHAPGMDKRVANGNIALRKNIARKDEAQQGRKDLKLFYRTRKFPEVTYGIQQQADREDFRTTIFWNGMLEIDKSGNAAVEFYNCDEISSFRATAEGHGAGMIGRTEKVFFTQLPFSMNVKIPSDVISGDQLSLPLTLLNNTNSNITGALKVKAPEGFKASSIIPQMQTIPAGGAKTIYLDYEIIKGNTTEDFSVSFTGGGHSDSFTKKIRTQMKGFPVLASFSANEMEKEFEIDINNYVPGSMQGSLTAYPSVLSDLMKGVESILREPSGCFEQTSMSSYPNVMVMDYLKTTGNKDEKLMASAEGLIKKGYSKLTSFETKEKGYEWFGSSPGHEALTAYGLMQFNDMKEVFGGVDQGMIDRTAEWLMNRRDNKGGFLRNGRALDNFGAASEDITNAYIVYALSEAGYTGIKKEYQASLEKALRSDDPYQLALLANASADLKENKNTLKCLEKLCRQQAADGAFNGSTHSVTRSTGNSLKIETTSLAVLAMLKSGAAEQSCIQKAVNFLVGSRSGHGAFGSTQGTILALKALTAYAKYSKATAEAGMISFYVDGKKVASQAYKAGEKDAIEIPSLERFISSGKHRLKARFENCKASLPYSLGISWHTYLPASSKECDLDIEVSTKSRTVKVGETLRMTAKISNKRNEGIASPIAIIGIPAGFTLQPWQLKELSERKAFDYYEIKGNTLVLYYRQFAPSEKKQIDLDLKAEIPGLFEAPASSAYLYYTNEFKAWRSLDKLTIRKS